ncbi:MAG: hypothetical protein OXF62_07745 [Caldilineaceae bacterium]|nr:hypothetical protein [Caldilineaceae bacterium]
MGQTVEAFLDSHDGGRDGAFTGKWRAEGGEDLCGPFVIQCKFTNRANYYLRRSDLSDEVEKARKLVESGSCNSYVLMTNAGVSGTRANEITGDLKAVGVKYVRILCSTWIIQQIRENTRLRMLVPRVYGLGDLSQILDERAYAQARAVLDSMREELAKVVVTDAYQRAVEAIDKHGFVLLIGEPASGKTTIASLLSMAALDNWGSSLLKLSSPDKVETHWNPDEPSQFFWLDDVFGVTQYDESSVNGWNHILPRIQPMLQRGARIVMTSRDYIYNRARDHLKESAFPLLNESQVVIDVHELTTQEKEQILYNHIKLGNQTRSFRTRIKPFLHDVASHPRFIPEIARRIGNRYFTKNLLIDSGSISSFVEKREELLRDIIRGLDNDSRAALALIYIRNDGLESPVRLRETEQATLERLGSSLGACGEALLTLKGSLTRLSSESGEPVWQFVHPTVGDAFAAILANNPEHIEIFIQGSEPERLMREVTCGNVNIENTVVVGRALFPQIIEKLRAWKRDRASSTVSLSGFGERRNLYEFLSYRCSKEFLSLFLAHDPELLNKVCHPGLYLDAVPEVRLVKRLHEFGLLPDEQRRAFVATVSDYALQGDDARVLSDDELRNIFTENEYDDLVDRLQVELLPRLDGVREMWEDNYSSSDLPEEYMQPHLDFLNSLLREFGEDPSAAEQIEREEDLTYQWIAENEIDELERSPRQLGSIESTYGPETTRSIFDDINADEQPETE